MSGCHVCRGRRLVSAWLPHTPGRRAITRCPACITAAEIGPNSGGAVAEGEAAAVSPANRQEA